MTKWRWRFDDAGKSTARNPSHTYAAAGTYNARLTFFDNADATHEWSAPVVVSAGSGAIALRATGRTDATKQYMVLRWTGASGSRSDIYRNGVRLVETPNDGRQTVSLRF